jgi:SAM-dependent methyltransferase
VSRTIKAFDEAAGFYDRWYRHPQGLQVFQAELRALERVLPGIGVGVEVGGGTGIFSEHLATMGRRIINVDPSAEMLAQARRRKQPSILAAGEGLPLRQGCLDFAFFVTVLEFLEDPANVFREVSGASKNDAPLALLFINRESPWGELYNRIGAEGDPVFQHANLYVYGEVEEVLEASGYEVVEAFGTLNSGPRDQRVGSDFVPVGRDAGVVIIKAVRTG